MQVPDSIVGFFSGAGGINIMASPNFLRQHTGIPRVHLPDYDIYHGGKDAKGKTVYTKYRLLGKESVHNTIQGVLEFRIIEGYGIKSKEGGEVHDFLRPNDAKKLMTEGSTSIKRNSVIVLKSGLLVRLEDVENFCDLPIIDKTRLFKSQTHVAITKRETYKMVRGTDNWAHVKRGALAREMERSVHKLLLPYYRKYRSEGDKSLFFKAFMEDILVVCNAHHSNFTEGDDFKDVIDETMARGTKRKDPCLINETRPRKKWGGVLTKNGCNDIVGVDRTEDRVSEVEMDEEGVHREALVPPIEETVEAKVKKALKNVSRSKMASIMF